MASIELFPEYACAIIRPRVGDAQVIHEPQPGLSRNGRFLLKRRFFTRRGWYDNPSGTVFPATGGMKA